MNKLNGLFLAGFLLVLAGVIGLVIQVYEWQVEVATTLMFAVILVVGMALVRMSIKKSKKKR
jgi:hypothetical protein